MTISAKIIADSINEHGERLTTFELEYPRIVHSELMTHRLFSRNAASSRAIPIARSIELILENTARPVSWGKNQSGMTAKEECTNKIKAKRKNSREFTAEQWWDKARDAAITYVRGFEEAKYHKQVANRLIEPFMHMKIVLTATNYANWYWLRDHGDADPTIGALANVMNGIHSKSTPVLLSEGEWHVPYFEAGVWTPSSEVTLEDALKISSSCCAQVSYRRNDDSLEKARDIYEKLVGADRKHASPFEHQGTPIPEKQFLDGILLKDWVKGVTHMDRDGYYWSGNFRGFIQHRQLIPGHNKEES